MRAIELEEKTERLDLLDYETSKAREMRKGRGEREGFGNRGSETDTLAALIVLRAWTARRLVN